MLQLRPEAGKGIKKKKNKNTENGPPPSYRVDRFLTEEYFTYFPRKIAKFISIFNFL